MATRALFRHTWARPLIWTGIALVWVFGVSTSYYSFTTVATALRFGIGVTVLFFEVSAVATVIVALLPPLRKLVPFAWRMWLWGTLGFICGFLLPDGVLVAVLMIIAVATGRNPFDMFAGSATALYFLPPTGAVMGGLIGIAFGHSSARHRIYRSSHSSVVRDIATSE